MRLDRKRRAATRKIPKMKNPTAILADDEICIRQLAACLLPKENVDVIGEARDGVEALKLCRKLKPTFLLTDLRLPGMDAVGVQLRLRAEGLPVPVMIYTGCQDDRMLAAALEVKPAVMVHKADSLDDFRIGVRAVAKGSAYFSPRIARVHALPGANGGTHHLTPEEIELLKLIAASKTTKEAADILGIAEKTASNRREAIMLKLDRHDAAALTRFAVKQGLVEA
jgi:DNA-binding NarL/FixJ family response regulator